MPEPELSASNHLDLKKDELINEEIGYSVVESHLRNGEIVLMGDMHFKHKTHVLFQSYMERLIKNGVPFSLAVELPFQLTPIVPQKTPEEIIQLTADIYRRAGSGLDAGFGKDLVEILTVAKKNNIDVFCINDGQEGPRVNNRDEWMVKQLKEAKTKGAKAILCMVGSGHVKATAIPKYIDALAIHMGEDKPFLGKKGFEPGMFDYQIKIEG
ncbi:MAG: hypothetical protein NUV73_03030, partial [Candidatus Daviesbacteria bacterium]|nr:hypothetical protein [Candidatus Daviesbacteria bacterium]